MVDHENLRTASLYINNQLLSRGLLRDGDCINFADPARGHGGTAATMGHIIGVVNHLILRRDRDAEQRESLATTLRTLRAESLHQVDDIARLKERNADYQRRLNTSEVSEASLRNQLRTAEAKIRGLKDETARSRSQVAQTRAACATEIRRRDRQIDTLKKQLGEAGRSRGAPRSSAVTTITVVPGEDRENVNDGIVGGVARPTVSTKDDNYDLRAETNEFLAELARGLSEENDRLLALVRQTANRLRVMSGWEGGETTATAAAVVSTTTGAEDPNAGVVVVVSRPGSQDETTADLDAVLEHLRTILTNPSFVPIEEVVVREDEIVRLRDGWVRMENRWKEAVHLMDGWRRRMAVSGRPVNDEELKMGLRLSPVRVGEVAETAHGLDLRISSISEEVMSGPEESLAAAAAAADAARRMSPCPVIDRSLRLVPASVDHEVVVVGRRGGEEDDRMMEYNDDNRSSSSGSSLLGDNDGGDNNYDGEGDMDMEEEEEEEEDPDTEEPNVQILGRSTSTPTTITLMDAPILSVRPTLGPLRDSTSAGNRGGGGAVIRGGPSRPRPGGCPTIVEEDTWDLAADAGIFAAVADPSLASRVNEHEAMSKNKNNNKNNNNEANSENRSPMPKRRRSASWKRDDADDDHKMDLDVDILPLPSNSSCQTIIFSPQTAEPTTAPLSLSFSPESESASSQSAHVSLLASTSASASASVTSLNSSKASSNSDTTAAAPCKISVDAVDTSSSRVPSPAETTFPPPPRPSTPDTRPVSVASNLPPPPPSAPRTPRSIAASRLPLPRSANAAPQQSPLTMATIAAKLAASEREADAARVRAKLRAARTTGSAAGKKPIIFAPRGRKTAEAPSIPSTDGEAKVTGAGVADPVKRSAPSVVAPPSTSAKKIESFVGTEPMKEPAKERGRGQGRGQGQGQDQNQDQDQTSLKRKRDRRPASRTANRRRSTLSPWELESLMAGGVPDAMPVSSPSRQ